MFKIGDFSKLSFVSVKTLRFYDEMGLLKPVKVDRFTGYRYYAADQLHQLNRILLLKDLGLSLEEIAKLLKEEVPMASILDIVRVKQSELKDKLQKESERLDRVEEWLEQLNKEGKMSEYEVVIKKVPPQKVASVRDVVPTYHAMFKWIEDNGYKIIGPDREIYMTSPEEVKSPHDNITEVQFPIAKA